MQNKRLISLILIIILIFSFSASVYADSNVESTVKEVIKTMKDIKESDWFAENVSMLYKLGIINGKPQKDGAVIFDPKGLVTKAEFTKMLVEAMEYDLIDGSSFSDIGYDRHWAKKYIETAVKEDVIDPEKEGEDYWLDIPIKRNDMAYMIFKALKLEPSNNKSPFPDADMPYATKLYEEFLINGSPEGNKVYFKPSGLTIRAEAAAIIARMVEYKEDPAAYKEKKIAEAKANEFVEPEFEVRKSDNKRRYVEIFINNYDDYDEDYKFKGECINYPQTNKSWVTALYGPPVEADYTFWRSWQTISANSGRFIPVYKVPYYADKAQKDIFEAKPGMVFEFKITIKKGDKEKEYIVPVEILE